MISPRLRFMSAHSANALSIGIQMVLVAWLAAGVLHLPATQIAWVQAALLAPHLLLILYAGALVDRHHPAQILMLTNLFLTLVHAGAAMLLLSGQLGLSGLMLYAFCLGCGNSFVQSAREKLVAQLDHRLQQNISLAGLCQYVAQGLGMLAASQMDLVGADLLIGLQAMMCAAALIAYASLRKELASGNGRADAALGLSIREGLSSVWRQLAIRHVVVVVGFNGLMHMGMLMVLLPVMARDTMGFSAMQYGLLQLGFTAGIALAHTVILHRKPVRYPGQAVLFCLLYAGVIGLAMSYGPTVYGLYGLVFLWGTVAGSSANLSRLVVQSTVSAEQRGRTMAVYQLALFGMAPVGALLAGALVTLGGVHLAFRVIAWSSAALFVLFLFTRALWGVTPAVTHNNQDGA